MFKKEQKGFTIIELLAVIVIIGIIMFMVRPAIQNIISNARYSATQESIKGYIREAELKSTTSNISINGIKIGPNKFVFETGADEDDLAKIKISGKYPDYVYMEYNLNGKVVYGRFCMNDYSIIYENNGFTDSDENYCSDDYIVTPIVSINNISVKSSSATLTFSVTDRYTTISTECSYGETPLYGNSGIITNNACHIDNLKRNKIYYYKICATNNKGRTGCRSDYLLTSNINNPTIVYTNTPTNEQNGYLKTQVLKITFNNANVQHPEYYIKSTLKATTNNNVLSRCGMDTIPKDCATQSTKEILPDNWYKVSGNINVTYDINSVNDGSFVALLSDGVDYSASTTVAVSKIDNEKPTIALRDTQATSNSLRINYSLFDSKSGIKNYTCKYGTTSGNYNNAVATANVSETSCIITGLNVRQKYYYQICATDNVGNSDCYTGETETASIIAPQITITKTPSTEVNGYLSKAVIKVFYSSVNVTNPEYYIKSSRVGVVPSGSVTSSCGTDTMPATCTTSSVTTLTTNTWYRVNRNIDVTYDTDDDTVGTLTALLTDGGEYNGATSLNIPKIDKTNPTITIDNKVIKTNSITLNYVLNDSKTTIKDYTCKYGTSSNNYNLSASSVTSASCIIDGLNENTTYYYEICTTDAVGNGPVCITDSDKTSSITNPTITYTNTPSSITYINSNEGDTHKGIVYMDPTNINTRCDSSSTINASSTTGCKKFYIYDDEGSTYKMIMDRNLGADVQWISKADYIAAGGVESDYGEYGNTKYGPITVMNVMNDRTVNWIGNPRIITADEVAHIVGADRNDTIKWSLTKNWKSSPTNIETEMGYFYLDGSYNTNKTSYSTTDGWQHSYASSTIKSPYAWLFDYTKNCVNYGCNNNLTSGSDAYWTMTKTIKYRAQVYYINSSGTMRITYSDWNEGIRPVIEIPKTLITRNNYYATQVANVTFSNTNIENPTYYIKSSKAGTTNVNTLQACGSEATPRNCTSSSVKAILANTWYKVSGNINVTYNTTYDTEEVIYAITYDGDNYSGAISSILSKIDKDNPTVRINNVSTTTNSAIITYTLEDIKSGIGSYTCKYGTTSGSYTLNGINITNTSCTLPNLTTNTTYYYQICLYDSVNNGPSCKEGNVKTNEFEPIRVDLNNTPSTAKNGYLKEQTASINYNADHITNPNYYINSTRAANVSSATLAACGNDTVPGTCTDSNTTSILANTWYKVSGDISVTYNEHTTTEAILYASLYDGYNYSTSSTTVIAKIDRNHPTYTVTPTSTTNSIILEYNPLDIDSGVGNITCKYSDIANTYTNDTNIINENKCIIDGLTNNKTYYFQVCISDLVENENCTTNSIKTKDFTKPIINLINTPSEAVSGYLKLQVAEVTYNSNNISEPTYYLKTTRAAIASTSTIGVCGTGDTPNINNCTNDARTTLSKDSWYKVTNTVNVTYNSDSTSNATLYAYTYDGNNLSGSEEKIISKIEYSIPEAPIITGGSNNWNTTSTNISLTAPGTAVSGVKEYEYYLSTSNIKPESTVTPTGTTSGTLNVTTEGINYIYYRTVSNAGNKSSWTDYQKVMLDTKVPNAPTITFNSGSNIDKWQNNIDIKLSSTDASGGSGISHYEIDNNNDGNSDATTTEKFIPTDGWNSNNTRFRAVDFAGKVSAWSSSISVYMDTTSPVLSNKQLSSLTYQNVGITLTISDNAAGIPDTPETYNNHRAGAYCVVSTSLDDYEDWTWVNATKNGDNYLCNIDPALFNRNNSGDTNFLVQIYVYDRAGNGGMLDRLNIVVPAKDYKATATCSSGTYQNGSCYFENNSNVCGCGEYNKTCFEYNQVCTEYNQVCTEWNTTCTEYNYSCSVNAAEGYTCDTCSSSNANEEVYCRRHTDNGFTYTTNTCNCTIGTCKTYTNTTCKTYGNGTCKTYINDTCKTYVDNLSSCKTANSCYNEAYITYSCPLGGTLVGDMCVRDTDTYTVTLDPNGGTISNGLTSKNTAVGYKYGYLPTPTREGHRFVGWDLNLGLDNENMWEQGGIVDAVGNNSDGMSTRIRTKYIEVEPNSVHSISLDNSIENVIFRRIWFYDENNVFISGRGVDNRKADNIITPANCKYIRIVIQYRNGTTNISPSIIPSITPKLTQLDVTKDNISTVAGNSTLTAKWEPDTYTVTLNPNGGTVSEISRQVTYSSTYGVNGNLPTPTKEGYTFIGWHGKNLFDKDDEPYISGKYIKGNGGYTNHESYSVYKIDVKPNTTYTITHDSTITNPGYSIYDINNVRVSGSNYLRQREQTFTTPGNAAYILISVITDESYSKYDADYFQLEEGDIATTYQPYYITNNTSVLEAKNHTLTAIWEANSNIIVTYDTNGGSEINTSKQVTYGSPYGELPTPVKEGYVFKGWNSKNLFDKDDEPYVSGKYIRGDGTKTSHSSYTIYKQFVKPNTTYTITHSKEPNNPGYVIYNSSGTRIAGSDYYRKRNITFTTPSDASYILFSVVTDESYERYDKDYFQLEEGSVATSYVPYLITPSTNVTINNDHTLKAIYTSYCYKEGISTLKECLIRNDSKDTYSNAINTINARTPNFNETVTDITKSGLFASDDDYTTNDQTKTYYYRGVVNNNWVKFGDYLWRIIRVNGDGSIRMMYSGLASSATHTGSNAAIGKTTYSFGDTTGYNKVVTDLYDSTKTVTTTYTNGTFGNTYVGYMYNPSRIFMTYPNKAVSSSYKLNQFPTYAGASTAEHYFFDSFDPLNDCDQSTSGKEGACTLKCRTLGNDGETGVNCVKATWQDIASAHTETTGTGTTSSSYLYTSQYKYTCWANSDAVTVTNADGTTSIYISCPIVSEILGTVKDEPTYAIVKYHGLFSSDEATSNQNILDSNAKQKVDTWYVNNILGHTDDNSNLLELYLSDEIFCNDRVNQNANAEWPLNKLYPFNYTRTRIYDQKSPTFKCLNRDGTFNTNDSFTLKTSGTNSTVTASEIGNNMLNYPIALITIDEAVYAGARYGSSYSNTSFWLRTGATYWTMSPWFFASAYAKAYEGYLQASGYLNSINTVNKYGLRPVINLKAGIKYKSGAGTEEDPYIVGLP